jgi:hypothetical protein
MILILFRCKIAVDAYYFSSNIHNWILIVGCLQVREDAELPEYILRTVRINCMRLDSAVHFEI